MVFSLEFNITLYFSHVMWSEDGFFRPRTVFLLLVYTLKPAKKALAPLGTSASIYYTTKQ